MTAGLFFRRMKTHWHRKDAFEVSGNYVDVINRRMSGESIVNIQREILVSLLNHSSVVLENFHLRRGGKQIFLQ